MPDPPHKNNNEHALKTQVNNVLGSNGNINCSHMCLSQNKQSHQIPETEISPRSGRKQTIQNHTTKTDKDKTHTDQDNSHDIAKDQVSKVAKMVSCFITFVKLKICIG